MILPPVRKEVAAGGGDLPFCFGGAIQSSFLGRPILTEKMELTSVISVLDGKVQFS